MSTKKDTVIKLFFLCFLLSFASACAIYKIEKPVSPVIEAEVEEYTPGEILPDGYPVVPVLVYHAVKKSPKQLLDVSAKEFDKQMNYLHKEGYSTLSLSEFFDFIYQKNPVPKKSILITFDDGRRSVFTEAYPILKKYGFSAAVFFYSDAVIQKYPSVMTREMIKKLSDEGYDLESHSKTHKRHIPWKKRDETEKEFENRLKKELLHPKKTIEKYSGREVRYFAYPFGQYSKKLIDVAKKTGYKGGFTVAGAKDLDGRIIKKGGNPFFVNPFEINRIQITQKTTLNRFKKNTGIFHFEPIYSEEDSLFDL